jgi:hypothetical protein
METTQSQIPPSQLTRKHIRHLLRVTTAAVIALVVVIGHRLIVEQMYRDYLDQKGSGWHPGLSDPSTYVVEFFLAFILFIGIMYLIRLLWRHERFPITVSFVSLLALAYLLVLWFSR